MATATGNQLFTYDPTISYDMDWARSLATKGKYDELPLQKSTSPCKNVKKVIKCIASVIAQCTIVIPVIKFIFATALSQCPNRLVMNQVTLPTGKLSATLRSRYDAITQRVQQAAVSAGLTHPIKVRLTDKTAAAAVGTKLMIIDPSYLIQEEDLPDVLQLDRVERGEVSEEAWSVLYKRWVEQEVGQRAAKTPKSQLAADREIIMGKQHLHFLQKGAPARDAAIDGVIGHELGHCKHNDSLGKTAINLGLELLTLPTLGLSHLFKSKVADKLSRRMEKKADLFSAKRLDGAAGMIDFFRVIQQLQQEALAAYPAQLGKFIDAEGNNLNDREHPPLSKRIKYLQQYQTQAT